MKPRKKEEKQQRLKRIAKQNSRARAYFRKHDKDKKSLDIAMTKP